MTQTNHAAAEGTKQPASGGGIKDTLESILVAFILAFIFRGFVVEAFVIPTGSMAPTLLGAHTRYVCADCGWGFDVSVDSRGEETSIPTSIIRDRAVICPNCGFPVTGGQPRSENVRYGDRILVLKYLYLFQDPRRWDVVVFKSPVRPQDYDYSQNYIKRLVGLPGETVMILDGDIYVAKGVATEQPRPSDFVIQTKTAAAQDALWRIVYDNDHHPQGLPQRGDDWKQPWRLVGPGGGWHMGDSPTTGRAFRFDDKAGRGAIEFRVPDGAQATQVQTRPLTDWVGYDQAAGEQQNANSEIVGDLKLSLIYERQAGEGPMRLKLSKRDDVFVAEIGAESAQLLHGKAGGELAPLGERVPLPRGRSLKLDFMNVDYQVTLKVNDRTLLQTTPQQYHPDVAALLAEGRRMVPWPTVQIEAERQSCQVSHVSLWRDVYYLSNPTTVPSWGNPGDFPDRLIQLSDEPGKKEYFVMGDNSRMSWDARYWPEPINLPQEDLVGVGSGRVPERFLLGKAFFVYWPAGYSPVAGATNVHIVPNFGEMRFIR